MLVVGETMAGRWCAADVTGREDDDADDDDV